MEAGREAGDGSPKNFENHCSKNIQLKIRVPGLCQSTSIELPGLEAEVTRLP